MSVEAGFRRGLRYSRVGSIGPAGAGLRGVHVANGEEELDRGRVGSVRRQLGRDEAARGLAGVSLVRRVLACGRAMIVAGVLGMNGRAGWWSMPLWCSGAPAGATTHARAGADRHANQRERKNEMGQGAKQAHGGRLLMRTAPGNH